MSDFCGPMDCSRTGSFVHGISQARILKWVAKSYSRGSSRPRDRTSSLVGRFLPLAPHRTQIYKHAYICTYIYTHTHIYIYTIKSLKAQPPKLMRVIIVIPIISLVTQGWLNVTLWGRNRLILFHMWWGGTYIFLNYGIKYIYICMCVYIYIYTYIYTPMVFC